MTDKQIIIEDCPHFMGGCCQEYLDGVCENHKCDLKIIRELEQKLKAKEQECETLASQLDFEVQKKECLEQECEELKRQHEGDKGLITSTGKMNYQLIQEYDKLKAENDELKEEIDDLKEIIQRHDNDNNALLSEFEDDLVEYYRKYKECLTEIKEIAEKMKNMQEECGKCMSYTAIQCKQILQKISEVEEQC